MQRIVAGFDGSGLSQQAFCHRHGLKLSTFTYWRRQLSDAAPASGRFLEIELVGDQAEAGTIELHLPGGARAVVGATVSESLISRLLRASRSSC
jgi:transposase-like protein